jgi:hypothetical protein
MLMESWFPSSRRRRSCLAGGGRRRAAGDEPHGILLAFPRLHTRKRHALPCSG